MGMIREKEDSRLSFLERKVQKTVIYLFLDNFLLSLRGFFWFETEFVPTNTKEMEVIRKRS